jgi:NodT family efflux transporter outer membrane factor (OMF) lipoprotein
MNSRQDFLHRPAAWLLGATLSTLAACTIGPAYQRPQAAAPVAFKEAPSPDSSWFPAAPADTLDRGPWWQLFGDPGLDALAGEVEVSNQNVAAAVAAYAQAQALVRERRAALFPSLALDANATRAGGAGAPGTGNSLRLNLGASWEPDIWGQLRLAVTGAQASAEASAANLAAARLSAQAALATDYFALREADNEIALLTQAVAAYGRSLRITQNQYDQGIAQRTDVLQAQTQLDTTRANLRATVGQRAVLEHAIALLVGKAPAGFSVPVAPWNARVPAVPLTVPSGLLQRRPDIAAAERAVAAANAQIGIQRSAYFPSLNLSASYGGAGTNLLALFRASNTLWSLGLSAAQTVFDAGAIAARVQGAVAARDAERIPGGRGPARDEPLARRAGGPAPRRSGRRRPYRAVDAESIPAGPRALHQRRPRPGHRAFRAPDAVAADVEPAGRGHCADPGAGWRLGGPGGLLKMAGR